MLPEDVEVVAAELFAAGALGVWERPDELVAWFAAPPDATGPSLPALPTHLATGRVEREVDRDWQAEWKATIGAVHAGRFAVVASWLAADHVAAPDETTVVLDPGRAFGSGHHATTTLCLELLDELDLVDVALADVGCGSGVLAIAAALRAARAVGTDLDPEAVAVTADNAAHNGVIVPVAVGSVAASLRLLGGPVDVVVANLVTDTVAELAPDLVAALGSTGVLVASGIAGDRRHVALDALTGAGLVVAEVRERDSWIALRGHLAAGSGPEVAVGLGRAGG